MKLLSRIKIFIASSAAIFALSSFAPDSNDLLSLFGKQKAHVQVFAKNNGLTPIYVLGQNTIALHKTENISVYGIQPMAVLLGVDNGVVKSMQIVTNNLPDDALNNLKSINSIKIETFKSSEFDYYTIFLTAD